MKTNKIIYSLLFLSMSLLWTGCADLLEVTPDDKISGDNFYQSEEDFKAATAPLYNKVWHDFNHKFYYGLGDGRSYNLYAPFSDYIYPFSDLNESGLTGPLVEAWQSFYNVVQQSNRVILGIIGSDVDEEIKQQYIAEARFIRGTAYWYLASLWGDVILCEDPTPLVNNPIVNKHSLSDVYEFVMRDLEYATKYLPESAAQAGRLTKYSGYAMLSRIYLYRAGLSADPNSGKRDQAYLNLAKQAAAMVIENGPYALAEEYSSLFEVDENNNSESIFALQWVPNSNYGTGNTQQAFFAPSSDITGDDAAWGWWTRASYDVAMEYETGDIRRSATWMTDGDYYPSIQIANGGYTHEVANSTYLNVKKGVVGSTKDNSKISRMNSALNTYMLRLAEVYLNYAEASLGTDETTTDETALMYFNMVRERAGLEAKESLSWEDIRHERRVELCMEGQYWYDLVRRAYYRQQEVVNYILSQSRDVIIPFTYDGATNTATYDDTREETNRAIGTVNPSIFILPYPESEVVQNPLLKEDPVPYEFNEERITDLF